ncbi:hypothetical protein SAMD00019534_072060 [Acytostelium subglobosum LB1]|uniref:hypothetical protein n=1 Tax=Acytostelium subglobosum LB1 TaxID=1410327 RepID=UPI000644F575|nr:hypothetical protein SAMD00019534_072060 [Acytostelium subglobosum LB1]GAM24031.1 hypothetical protein SAMD00019534_072060 [Acytostelium subglobosum LB1]|eukprot:XP_012753067.1 hypothetical protein SAMD00019534_072060 [Acytostelium subglobosum LB1]
MKINIELLKAIILGSNFNELTSSSIEVVNNNSSSSSPQQQSPPSPKVSVRSSTKLPQPQPQPPKTQLQTSSQGITKPIPPPRSASNLSSLNINNNNNSNNSNNNNNNSNSSVNTINEPTTPISSDKQQQQQQPSTPNNNNNTNNNHIPFVLTSTLVPLSTSFSPSSSSLLSSGNSPNTFSPLNSYLNNSFLDFESSVSPPTSPTSSTHITTSSPSPPTSAAPSASASTSTPATGSATNVQQSKQPTPQPPQSQSQPPLPQPRRQSHSSLRPPNHHHRLKQRTLFEKLYTESGFNTAKNWYERNTQQTDFTMGEAQFLLFMRHLTDFSYFHILDLFDALDRDDIGVVGFEEFFLIIALFASRECGQTTKFLYQHSRVMFEILAAGGADLPEVVDDGSGGGGDISGSGGMGMASGPGNTSLQQQAGASSASDDHTINFHRFTKFAKILGIAEYQVLGTLEKFNIVIFDQINFEMFLVYYFVILDEWDRSNYAFLKALYHDPDYTEPFVPYDESTGDNTSTPGSSTPPISFNKDFQEWLDGNSIKLDDKHKNYLKAHLLENHIVSFEIAASITEEEWAEICDKMATRKAFLKALREKLIRRQPPKRLLSRVFGDLGSNTSSNSSSSGSGGTTSNSNNNSTPVSK